MDMGNIPLQVPRSFCWSVCYIYIYTYALHCWNLSHRSLDPSQKPSPVRLQRNNWGEGHRPYHAETLATNPMGTWDICRYLLGEKNSRSTVKPDGIPGKTMVRPMEFPRRLRVFLLNFEQNPKFTPETTWWQFEASLKKWHQGIIKKEKARQSLPSSHVSEVFFSRFLLEGRGVPTRFK